MVRLNGHTATKVSTTNIGAKKSHALRTRCRFNSVRLDFDINPLLQKLDTNKAKSHPKKRGI